MISLILSLPLWAQSILFPVADRIRFVELSPGGGYGYTVPSHAQPERTFITLEEASRTVFADSFTLMSEKNRLYVLDNIKGVWILPLNDTDHPYRYKGRAYVNELCGHTLYIGWEQLGSELTEDNAEMLGHEAAHGACHQHGNILWRIEADIRVDIWEAKNGPLLHVTRQHAIDFIMLERHGHK